MLVESIFLIFFLIFVFFFSLEPPLYLHRFFLYFEDPRYPVSRNDFQPNVKRISLQSASRLVSYRKITPSKVRTIRKFCQSFRRDGKGVGKFGRFRLMGRRVKGNVFRRAKGLARVSKSSLHDQTYALFIFFIFFLSLVILIFVSYYYYFFFFVCSFCFIHPIRLLLILLHPKYCENVTVYCK